MSSQKYRQKTRLLPLNLLSQQHLESPSKHRHIISNAAIPKVLRKDSASQDFDSLLKSSNYPYLSKINFGRRRHTSNKRPENINRSPMEERFHFKTEVKKGSLSESKGKSRYHKRQSDGQAVNKTKRFFDGTEDSENFQRQSRNPQNNRSYFLKKLKQRYGNKHIHCSTQKTELKVNSEKVTLMQHSNEKTQEVFEDEHGVQTMILSDPLNFKTPQEIIKKFGDAMNPYEKDVEIHDYPQIYYFTEECIEMGQPPEGQTAQSVYDDKQGGYLWKPKGHIAYRYQIVNLLGQGSFGQVFKCIDHKDEEEVAVKLVRNRQKYTKQAQVEIEILSYVRQNDPNMNKNLVEVKDNFRWRQHTCIIFELLSINLYELIKMNDYYGLPLDLIRRFSLQILNGLHFLHKHEIIHADLKPQNILLKQPNKSGLKIIDFGSSCFIKQRIYTYIQSRYYRAPEVILGVPYDYKIDIWSFACILAQLYIGYPIFPGENEKQQIWLIMETIGCPPLALLENSTRKHHYFDESLRPLQYNSMKGKEYRVLGNSLSDIIDEKDSSFCRFLEFCLTWHPSSRPTALQCLRHEWILEGLPEDIRKQHLKFIDQQEQIARAERRKRSPPVRQMKVNESPPARARPPYFDRSRERHKLRADGPNSYPLSKNFHGIQGFRTRNIHPL